MRILMVGHYPPHKGGVARHVKELVGCLRKRHEVHVLTYGTVKVEEEGVYSVKVPNIFGLRGVSFVLLASKVIRRLHEKNAYDVIHAHYVGTTSYSSILSGVRPVVITAHGSDLEFMSKLPLGRYFVKESLIKADKVIAVSHYLAKKALALGAREVKVIPNWTALSGRSERKAIVFLGRIAKYKGVDDFIKLAEHFPNEEFIIAGEGPRIKAPENVRFLGYVRAEEVLSRAKILVLPSRREGFGLVILEANSFGVPVLGRAIGGIRELIRHGKNGYLFSTLEEAIEFLSHLLEGKEGVKRGTIGKRISTFYSLERACREIEKVYEEVVR
ncbi:glycosyltransferase family 4 protein [Pyrococcus kukulkanii]|uniref:glycosyltransferase family 4 protein n=1 Tax=Pyrococcus kukulkanii TaxID=1609559 RepID=UPI0035637B84